MKSISYNPTVALSILLAAVFMQKHPGVEVKTTSATGTNFKTKFAENELSLSSAAVALLSDEGDSEVAKNLELGIVSGLYDVTKFEHQFELIKIFNGDNARHTKVSQEGVVVAKFLSSPAFAQGKYEVEEVPVVEEKVDGPVTSNDDTDTDPNSEKTVDTDVNS